MAIQSNSSRKARAKARANLARTKKEENPLFVGISDGNELRRSMLECSRDILESLKEHEKFKAIREEKIRMIAQLRSDIRNTARLINSLRGYLPKVKELGVRKVEVKKAKEEKPVKVEPQSKTELERLEAELNEIENKLNSFS